MAEAEDRHWWFWLTWEEILAWRGERSKILDVGCGTGGLLGFLQRSVPDLALTGLDYSDHALTFAREKSDASLVQGDATRLPFADAAFDLVVSVDVLYTRQAYPGFADALRDMRRVLRPGGRLLLHLPAFSWLSSDHDTNVHGVHRFTRPEVVKALREAGFGPIRAYYRYAALLPIAWLMRKAGGHAESSNESHVRVPDRAINQLMYACFAVEGMLGRALSWLPFGLSVFAICDVTEEAT